MRRDEYDALVDVVLTTARDVANAKRPAYTIGSEDVLANFKRIGDRTGLDAAKVLDIYMLKHLDSITAYSDGSISQAEPILERFADAINYLLLKFALLVERNDELQLTKGED
jgi:hypothetical protein